MSQNPRWKFWLNSFPENVCVKNFFTSRHGHRGRLFFNVFGNGSSRNGLLGLEVSGKVLGSLLDLFHFSDDRNRLFSFSPVVSASPKNDNF